MTDNTIKFGDRVRISARYERKTTLCNGWDQKKEYIPKPFEAKGLYLGRRRISNGGTICDEEGLHWMGVEWFMAGLVCLNQNENPIYVPLGNIHRVET